MKKQKQSFYIILTIIIALIISVILSAVFIKNEKKLNAEVYDSILDQSSYDLEVILNQALQDEYHAEAVYQQVITTFGEITPYINIIRAERKHSQTIKNLYAKYDLQVPNNEWANLDKVPSFDSIKEACQASAQAEIDNIALYDELLPNIKESDIKSSFTSLSDASRDKHLPAFNKCS